jgi:predicted metal-dependent hydrolase
MAQARSTVIQGGRPKAYRPIPAANRRLALESAIEAYDRGDFFEAHEILEPAWMGTDDIAERELYQGLIKLSAAFVHSVRGNPRGIVKNLVGARERLAAACATSPTAGDVDLVALLAAIDERLAMLTARPDDAAIDPPILRRTS